MATKINVTLDIDPALLLLLAQQLYQKGHLRIAQLQGLPVGEEREERAHTWERAHYGVHSTQVIWNSAAEASLTEWYMVNCGMPLEVARFLAKESHVLPGWLVSEATQEALATFCKIPAAFAAAIMQYIVR